MHRIDHPTRSVDENGPGKDGWTEGDPVAGVPFTIATDDWFNAVQEEIANLIEARGITLVKGDQDQLREAIFGPNGNREWTYATPQARTVWIQPDTLLFNATDWQGSVSALPDDVFFSVLSQIDGGTCTFLPDRYLPTGAVITDIDVLANPGANATTLLQADLYRVTYSGASTPTSTKVATFTPSVTGVQFLPFSGLTEAVDRATKTLALVLRAGSDTTHQADQVHGVRLTFTDPGPRNF